MSKRKGNFFVFNSVEGERFVMPIHSIIDYKSTEDSNTCVFFECSIRPNAVVKESVREIKDAILYEDRFIKEWNDGYEQCRKDITSNPMSIFDLLPDMQKSVMETIEKAKRENSLSDEQQHIIAKATRGEVNHAGLIEILKTYTAK